MGRARQIGGLFQYDNCWPTQANDVAMRLGVMKSKHFPSKRIFVFLFRIFDKLSMWNIDSEMPKMVRRWVSLTLIDSHKGKRRCSRSANGINIYFFLHPQRSSERWHFQKHSRRKHKFSVIKRTSTAENYSFCSLDAIFPVPSIFSSWLLSTQYE